MREDGFQLAWSYLVSAVCLAAAGWLSFGSGGVNARCGNTGEDGFCGGPRRNDGLHRRFRSGDVGVVHDAKLREKNAGPDNNVVNLLDWSNRRAFRAWGSANGFPPKRRNDEVT